MKSIMTNKSTTPANAVSRRHFLLSASLATTALGLKPLAGWGASGEPARADAWETSRGPTVRRKCG
jgi:hypothetical protein